MLCSFKTRKGKGVGTLEFELQRTFNNHYSFEFSCLGGRCCSNDDVLGFVYNALSNVSVRPKRRPNRHRPHSVETQKTILQRLEFLFVYRIDHRTGVSLEVVVVVVVVVDVLLHYRWS
jgi:hypothetical protein